MMLSKKILIADDEQGIRALLSEFLVSKGFQVSQARDGQECLDQLVAKAQAWGFATGQLIRVVHDRPEG